MHVEPRPAICAGATFAASSDFLRRQHSQSTVFRLATIESATRSCTHRLRPRRRLLLRRPPLPRSRALGPALGTRLETGLRYTPTTCFETFPLPWPPGKEPKDDPLVTAIAAAAAGLDRLRNGWLNPPPEAIPEEELKKRTLTNLYNQRPTWLELAHRALDHAVFAAYGWPDDPSDQEILARLLALNLQRASANSPSPAESGEARYPGGEGQTPGPRNTRTIAPPAPQPLPPGRGTERRYRRADLSPPRSCNRERGPGGEGPTPGARATAPWPFHPPPRTLPDISYHATQPPPPTRGRAGWLVQPTLLFRRGAPPMARCTAFTNRGAGCLANALHGSPYCLHHEPAKVEARRQNAAAGGRASGHARRQPGPIPTAGIDLSDRAGIQAAVDAVVPLELVGRISQSRSRNILRALAIAARNFNKQDLMNEIVDELPTTRLDQARALLDQSLPEAALEGLARDEAPAHGAADPFSPSPVQSGEGAGGEGAMPGVVKASQRPEAAATPVSR